MMQPWAIDHTMNKDANNGEIHPLSYPPVKLQSMPTIIAAIRIGTIVILKLKNKRTNHSAIRLFVLATWSSFVQS